MTTKAMALSIPALVGRSDDTLMEALDIHTISPLPKHFRDGMTAIAVFVCLSFALTTSLWVYLNYKLMVRPVCSRTGLKALAGESR